MSKKVAKLVAVSLLTRVVVSEDATDEEIMQTAKANYQKKLDNNELMDNLEYIDDDTEMPFGDGIGDVYYQPEFEDDKLPISVDGKELYSFEVYLKKENAEKDFPNSKIIEYSGGDIENPTFVDF